MPKSYLGSYTLPYSWPRTALSVLHKYPNPVTTHVVSVDVLDQQFDEATGLIRLERVLGVRQGAPAWVTKVGSVYWVEQTRGVVRQRAAGQTKLLGGGEDTWVREVVMIDGDKNLLEMTSTNLSLSQYLLAKEYITYAPTTPMSSDSTTFTQRAVISCQGLPLRAATRKVEDLSHARFGNNAGKGKLGLEAVLGSMWGYAAETANL